MGERENHPLQIRVRFCGELGAAWLAPFGHLQMVTDARHPIPETTVRGQVANERALIDILNLLYDLGCPLVYVHSALATQRLSQSNAVSQ